MKKDLTNEEMEVLRLYKTFSSKQINMLLKNDAETDIAFFSKEGNDKKDTDIYTKMNLIKNIDTVKSVYSIMLKIFYQKLNRENWSFTKLQTLDEVNMLKNEMYIDEFIFASEDIEKINLDNFDNLSMPVLVNVIGQKDIPYINFEQDTGVLNVEGNILISPFTKITNLEDRSERTLKNGKTVKVYNLYLDKQESIDSNETEINGLYTYIVSNADLVNEKLNEAIDIEKRNEQNYEEIRKLEQLVNKFEMELDKKESEGISEREKQEDLDNIDRINNELNSLREQTSLLYQKRKDNCNFITNWKKSVSTYINAECNSIAEKYIAKDNVLKEMSSSKIEKLENEFRKEEELKNEKNLDNIIEKVKNECEENISAAEKIAQEIQNLIIKQQNHAKIAGDFGTNYSALNNCFEMKEQTEELKMLLEKLKDKVEGLCLTTDRVILDSKLIEISKINIQINTLINYLNNPKTSIGKAKISRFDEMAIVEENALKRGIAQKILYEMGDAELKKLKDDVEIIEDKSSFKRFLGMITGRNKIDEYMLEQIEIRKNAIKKTLSKKLELSKNYSIHELVAKIEMFIKDNIDDELVENEIKDFKKLEQDIRRNFVISDGKVEDIINKREAKNLPIDIKKISKKELIEIETYRFLNKYGYDIDLNNNEPEYQDTMANEIKRIIEYINSSKILE